MPAQNSKGHTMAQVFVGELPHIWLETLKNNAWLEVIYQVRHALMQTTDRTQIDPFHSKSRTFKFCLKHQCKVEFRRLCKTHCLHLPNAAKYSCQPHSISLSDADTLQHHPTHSMPLDGRICPHRKLCYVSVFSCLVFCPGGTNSHVIISSVVRWNFDQGGYGDHPKGEIFAAKKMINCTTRWSKSVYNASALVTLCLFVTLRQVSKRLLCGLSLALILL